LFAREIKHLASGASEARRQMSMKRLSRDEAQLIAANIAKPPRLAGKK
jgi:hypothetical protein